MYVMKDLLMQFWRLTITRHDGSKVNRAEFIYANDTLCYGLSVVYYHDEDYFLRFCYFEFDEDDPRFVNHREWHTSKITNINEDGDKLIITTKNSIYTFVKTDETPQNIKPAASEVVS